MNSTMVTILVGAVFYVLSKQSTATAATTPTTPPKSSGSGGGSGGGPNSSNPAAGLSTGAGSLSSILGSFFSNPANQATVGQNASLNALIPTLDGPTGATSNEFVNSSVLDQQIAIGAASNPGQVETDPNASLDYGSLNDQSSYTPTDYSNLDNVAFDSGDDGGDGGWDS